MHPIYILLTNLTQNGTIIFDPLPFNDPDAIEASLDFLFTANYKTPDSSFRALTATFHAKIYVILSRLGVIHGEVTSLALFSRTLEVAHKEPFFTDTIRNIWAWGSGPSALVLKDKVLALCWENSEVLILNQAFLSLCHSTPAFGNAFYVKLVQAAKAYRDLPPEQKAIRQ